MGIPIIDGNSITAINTIKKKCYKVPARIVEKYFQGMDANMVDTIVEQALDAWFGKEAADVQ